MSESAPDGNGKNIAQLKREHGPVIDKQKPACLINTTVNINTSISYS